MNALEIENVTVAGRLHAVSLALPVGKRCALIGPNGSGKSTLLQVAAGLLPVGGTVSWNGRKLSDIPIIERARLAAWVPQEAHFEFGFTVWAVVAQARYAYGDDERGVEEALQRFDLTLLAERPVNQLSGGERQRVLLARAVATGARLQLWDEPLAALDPRHALEMLRQADAMTRMGATLLFSLHDLRVAQMVDHVLVMHEGRLRAAGVPAEVLTPGLLREVFGVEARMESGWTLGLP